MKAGGKRRNSTWISFSAWGEVCKKGEGSAQSDCSKAKCGGDGKAAGRTDRSVTKDFFKPSQH